MARGTILWRCSTCKLCSTTQSCDCPKGKYRVRYPLGDGAYGWISAGKNKKDAERLLLLKANEVAQGVHAPNRTITFREFAEEWLRDFEAMAQKQSTVVQYRGHLERWVFPAVGNYPLVKITPRLCRKFVVQCLEKGAAKRSVVGYFSSLRRVLSAAQADGYLPNNPASRAVKLEKDQAEMDFLKPDEIKKFLAQADEPYKTFFKLCVLTGMRRGEAIALRKGDIDWHNNLIYVRQAVNSLYGKRTVPKEKLFLAPKSKRSIRTIEITPELRKALQIHLMTARENEFDLVFCNGAGMPLHPENLVKREFIPALRRAGLRLIRFHDLRHTHTALLIALGYGAKFIQMRLGHESIQTTMDVYGHLLPETYKDVGVKLDAMLSTDDSSQDKVEGSSKNKEVTDENVIARAITTPDSEAVPDETPAIILQQKRTPTGPTASKAMGKPVGKLLDEIVGTTTESSSSTQEQKTSQSITESGDDPNFSAT